MFKAACLESRREISGLSPSLVFKFQSNKIFLPRSLVDSYRCSIVGSLRDEELDARPQTYIWQPVFLEHLWFLQICFYVKTC